MDAIMSHTDITLTCIVDNDQAHADRIRQQIGDAVFRSPDKKKKLRRHRKENSPVTAEPQMAVVKGGDIYIEPIA